MSIIGHGIDIVDMHKFADLLADETSDFVSRCFTPAEQLALDGSPGCTATLAGKFAAKEAVAKALGTGFTRDVAPIDIEIGNSNSGSPLVTLTGSAADLAERLGIHVWHLSIGHTSIGAVASAIAVGISKNAEK